jgi:hypothetical protein
VSKRKKKRAKVVPPEVTEIHVIGEEVFFRVDSPAITRELKRDIERAMTQWGRMPKP